MGNKQNNRKKLNEHDEYFRDENKRYNINNIKKIKDYICKYYILFAGKDQDDTNLIERIEEGQYIDKTEKYCKKIIYEKNNKEFILYLIDSNPKFEEEEIDSNEEIKIMHLITSNYPFSYYYNFDCIIMRYDATNKESLEELKIYWDEIIKDKIKTNLIYLLGNKIDLQDNIELPEIEGKEFADKNNIKYFTIADKDKKNIKNLINDIKKSIEKIDDNNEKIIGNPSKSIYKISFLGDSEVGTKTSLINRLIYDKFNHNEFNKSPFLFYPKLVKLKNDKEFIINLWDISGDEKYRQLVQRFMEDSDAVILGYDITKKESFDNIKDFWYKESKEYSKTDLIYLIANKADLYEEEEVDEGEAKDYAKENNMRYFMISCKDSYGIKEFENDLITQLIKYNN